MLDLGEKKLNRYKEYVAKRLATIKIILQKVAMGDFSENIEIPETEDEFTECLVAVNLMIGDLREMMREIKQKTAELEKTKVGLEEEVTRRTKELQGKVLELARFNKVAVGRELKMVELKEEIAQLKKQLGEVAEKSKEPVISQEPVTSKMQAIPANPGQSPEPAGTLNQKPDSKSTKTLKYKTHD